MAIGAADPGERLTTCKKTISTRLALLGEGNFFIRPVVVEVKPMLVAVKTATYSDHQPVTAGISLPIHRVWSHRLLFFLILFLLCLDR